MTGAARAALVLGLTAAAADRVAAGPAAQGLSVRKDGVLVKDGRPFCAIGVNYFNAFYRHLKDWNVTPSNARAGQLRAVAEANGRIRAAAPK